MESRWTERWWDSSSELYGGNAAQWKRWRKRGGGWYSENECFGDRVWRKYKEMIRGVTPLLRGWNSYALLRKPSKNLPAFRCKCQLEFLVVWEMRKTNRLAREKREFATKSTWKTEKSAIFKIMQYEHILKKFEANWRFKSNASIRLNNHISQLVRALWMVNFCGSHSTLRQAKFKKSATFLSRTPD